MFNFYNVLLCILFTLSSCYVIFWVVTNVKKNNDRKDSKLIEQIFSARLDHPFERNNSAM